jgi:hypothetical protein
MLANDDLGNLGRLGNQMFQYTSLRGLAAKHGYDYCLPPREVVATRDERCRNSDTTIFETFKLPDVPRMVTNFPKHMEANNFFLDENLFNNCPDNISLYGYFQTEKYFKHIEQDIRDAFTFVDEVQVPVNEFFQSNFGKTPVISLHIRRTDYLLYSETHRPYGIEYAQDALKHFDNDLPVMIFSDDIEWCKEQKFFKEGRFNYSENNSTPVDLCLQSLCTYHIICNSSFSWWGSWLAKSKKTVAPWPWYENIDMRDLYMSDWTILKYQPF